jgi:hypothetical protein
MDESFTHPASAESRFAWEAELRQVTESLKERIVMRRLLPAILCGTCRGVGSGALDRSADILVSRSALGTGCMSSPTGCWRKHPACAAVYEGE